MFNDASSFNQNLSDWCVNATGISYTDFATNSLIVNPPIWGTCP